MVNIKQDILLEWLSQEPNAVILTYEASSLPMQLSHLCLQILCGVVTYVNVI